MSGIQADRSRYLKKLISKKQNGLIKVVTGIRRSGKSFLLFKLYKQWLLESGVAPDHIICVQLDDDAFIAYRNPIALGEYIRSQLADDGQYYVLIDEIQFCKKIKNPHLEGDYITFYEVLNGLLHRHNVDTYVTGSNSRMLTTDILTEFRGRGDEIQMYPLTFEEYRMVSGKEYNDALSEYLVYGGMPYLCHLDSDEDKSSYLKSLFTEIYLKDIIERNDIQNTHELDILMNVLASAIGSFTNPSRISDTFKSNLKLTYDPKTVAKHIKYLKESFVIEEAERYDLKGRRYIGANSKYYFSDVGLRNARIGFRQQEITHIMENLVYNELIARDFLVDVGIVELNSRNEQGKSIQKQLEVDFVAKKGGRTYYIQSAFSMTDPEKAQQELMPLKHIRDSFQKIIISYDLVKQYYDEDGFLNISLKDFLSAESPLQ